MFCIFYEFVYCKLWTSMLPKQILHKIWHLCQRKKFCAENRPELCTSQRTTLLCCALIWASRPCADNSCAQLFCAQRFHARAQLRTTARTRPAHNSVHNAPQPYAHNSCSQHRSGCAQRNIFP